jgi:asparagine synthase (glutamine-hydrolysing)
MPGIAAIFSKAPDSATILALLTAALTVPPGGVRGTQARVLPGVHVGWALHFHGRGPTPSLARDPGAAVSAMVAGELFLDAGPAADASAVVLRAYAEHGDRFVEHLNGSFAGVLVDERRGVALLFNDRFGSCRLYLHETDHGLFVASEAKALLRRFEGTRRLDATAVAETISLGCTLRDRTLYEGITLLPPGSLWVFDGSRTPRRGRWFDPDTWERQTALADEDFYEALKSTFAAILPRYLGGTPGPAMSLTGGIDGRMIMAWARLRPGQMPCYSFGGIYRECHDVRLARRIAQICGQTHRTFVAGTDMLRDFPRLAAQCIEVSDGTMDVSGAVELHVNRLAREVSPIRLTGNYGSEIVRGNVAFRPRKLRPGVYAHELAPLLDAAARTFHEERQVSDLRFVAFKQVPWHHHARLSVEQSLVTMRTPFLDPQLVGLMFRASPAMRLSRDASLRLIHDGDQALGALPTDRAIAHGRPTPPDRLRHVLREFSVRAEYAYDYGMPDWLARTDQALRTLQLERLFLGRHKFYHFRIWYRDALAGFLRETLLSSSASVQQWFRPGRLQSLVDEHVGGHANHTLDLHRALTLELVSRQMLSPQPGCVTIR